MHRGVAIVAATSLGKLGDRTAIPPLKASLHLVFEQANEALVALGVPEDELFDAFLKALVRDGGSYAALAEGVAERRSPMALPALRARFAKTAPTVSVEVDWNIFADHRNPEHEAIERAIATLLPAEINRKMLVRPIIEFADCAQLLRPSQGVSAIAPDLLLKPITPDLDNMVPMCKEKAVRGMERFLKTLSFVPDDKLTWSPSPTAKTTLRIAAHTAIMAGNFAQLIRNGKFPPVDKAQLFAALKTAEEAITTREAAIELLRKNTDEVLAALDAATPELIVSTVETPFGFSAPMAFFMNIPGSHADSHAAQIDYLQTCWGDLDMHM